MAELIEEEANPPSEVSIGPDDLLERIRQFKVHYLIVNMLDGIPYSPLHIHRWKFLFKSLIDFILGKRSYYLHILIFICSFSWSTNALTCLAPAFFDGKEENSSYVSLSDEFDLNNDRVYLRDFASSAFMIGNMFGGLFMSPLSDAIGRRPILAICSFALSLICLLLSVSPNIYVFIVLRLVMGMSYTGACQSSWVLAFECCPSKLRPGTAFIFGMTWVLGYCALAPIAMLSDSWRMLMLIITVPCIVFFAAVIFFIPESLHYVVIMKRHEAVRQWSARLEEQTLIETEEVEEKKSERVPILKFIKGHERILTNTILVSLIWTSDAFIYFGLSLYSTKLDGNVYINFLLLGLIEIPAYIITHLFLKKFSRKTVIFSTHFAAAVSFLAIMALPSGSIFALIGWIFGKLGISTAYMGMYVVAGEIFPTDVRGSVLGVCTVVSGIGGIFAPYASSLARINHNLPLIVFALVSLSGAFIGLLLPETKDKPLHETNSTQTDSTEIEVSEDN